MSDRSEPIRFTRPHVAGPDVEHAVEAMRSDHSHGDGPFTRRATQLLADLTGSRPLLTTSCTAALEMAALLLDLGPGDEVVVPSFTFVSTAGAVAMRGATPVFADVTPDTLNLDVEAFRAAITPRTRAVYVVHYGGVACDMDEIGALAAEHGIAVVEDNAHGLGARYRGRTLGTLGALATQSFHDTKNVQCGEGGALLVNDPALVERAEVVREKGTNRSRFLRGQVDKYTWEDLGSSYLMSDVSAAFLTGQLECFEQIQQERHRVWNAYAAALPGWAGEHGVQLPVVPEDREHPAHVFQLLLPTPQAQDGFIAHLKERGITAPFHYLPLHLSPAGRRYGRTSGDCAVTESVSRRLSRLPLFPDLTDAQVERVVEAVTSFRP